MGKSVLKQKLIRRLTGAAMTILLVFAPLDGSVQARAQTTNDGDMGITDESLGTADANSSGDFENNDGTNTGDGDNSDDDTEKIVLPAMVIAITVLAAATAMMAMTMATEKPAIPAGIAVATTTPAKIMRLPMKSLIKLIRCLNLYRRRPTPLRSWLFYPYPIYFLVKSNSVRSLRHFKLFRMA